ncbi:MAG: hypothetical protein M3Y09_01925 [Actinomycetota bacterium]|nr:hypothetical protein [Actinomycetota bacterium]
MREPCPRAVRRLAGLEAAILTAYGGVLTGTGLAVQAGLVGVSANADWKALDWHTYLWDPWFLVVGLLIWVALRRTRSVGPERRRGLHGRSATHAGRLVTTHFLHPPDGEMVEVATRLAEAVAPGGHLLIVGLAPSETSAGLRRLELARVTCA